MDEVEEVLEVGLNDLSGGLNRGAGALLVCLSTMAHRWFLLWEYSRRWERVAPMHDLQKALDTASELRYATCDML